MPTSEADLFGGFIPPTKALYQIFVGADPNNNVTAGTYFDNVTFIEGAGITITPDYLNNEITFTGIAGSISTFESLTNVTDVGCALNQIPKVNSTGFWACSNDGGGAETLTWEQLSNVTDSFCTTNQVRKAVGNQWVCANIGISGGAGGGANVTAGYIIVTNGAIISAINGTTGDVKFSGSDAATIIENSINDLADHNGGLVFIKSGVYTITSTIELRGKVTIQGENILSTRLYLGNNADVDMFAWDGSRATEFFPQMRSLTLEGNRANNVLGNGIKVVSSGGHLLSDGFLDNMFIFRFSESGIDINYLWGWEFVGVVVEQNDGNGATLNGDSVRVVGSRFLDNELYGILQSGGSNLYAYNQFRDNGRSGLFVQGAVDGVAITNNIFYDNGNTLINSYPNLYISNNDNVMVASNFFDGASVSSYGIYRDCNADYTNIIGNAFKNHVSGNLGACVTKLQNDNIVSNQGVSITTIQNQTYLIKAVTSTANREPILILKAKTSANMANLFGAQINFTIEDNALVENSIGSISVARSGADNVGAMRLNVNNSTGSFTAIFIPSPNQVTIPNGNFQVSQGSLNVITNDINMTGISRVFDINTNKIKGSMTCSNGQILEYDSASDKWICGIDDTAGTLTLENLSNVTDDFCTTNQVRKASGNQWICATDNVGAGQLNDLSDVTITGVAYNHILQYSVAVGQWINKLFTINTQTPQTDFQIIGINNQTGVITTNQFSVNTLTCGGTDKISSIDNATGNVICSADSGGSVALDDLTDVTLTAPAYNHILQYRGTQWINKLFALNTQSASNDVFVTGINNQTGAITTNQFSVNTQASAVDRQITGINNVTGEITRNTFSVNTQASAVDQQITGIDNSTGQITRNTFSVNTQASAVDQQITGIDNSTGQITRTNFSVNSLTCGGTDKISSINNATGQVICTTDATGAGGSGIPLPPKKWGQLIPKSASADTIGLVSGCTILGTATFVYDVTDGSNAILSTTAITDGVNGGIHCTGTDFNAFTGTKNAYMYSRWEENKITTNRIFIGFSGPANTLLPNNADTIVDSIDAAGLCIRTSDTVYQFCHNDGTGAGIYESLTTSEDAGAVHFFEVYTTDAGVTWCGKLDGGTAVCSSTAADIPTTTDRLFAVSTGETDGGATAILWTQYQWYIESGR